jgi:hypothetical protein
VKNRAKIKPALFQVAAALVIVNECVNLIAPWLSDC